MRTARAARLVVAGLGIVAFAGVASAQAPAPSSPPTPSVSPTSPGTPAPAGTAAPATPAPTATPAAEAAPAAAAPAAEETTHTRIGGFNVEGYGEVGLRFFPQKPSEAQEQKFMEYQDLNTGLYLDNLRLRFYTPDEKYSIELNGSNWGLKTMELDTSVTRTGLWEAGFQWDQMRQLFSTDSKMLSTEVRDGVFTLPSPRPPLGAYNQIPFRDEIGVQWNTARIFFKLTPTPDTDLFAQYTRIRKDGDIPMGMAFGSPGTTSSRC